MGRELKHLSDEQLLRAADGELGAAQAEEARRHLADCGECRERAAALEAASADFAAAYRGATEASMPPGAFARAKLRARLAAEQEPRRGFVWLGLSGRGWAMACMAVLLAALGVLLAYDQVAPRGSRLVAYGGLTPLIPDAKLTPGAVRPVALSQVCSAGGPAENRPPSSLQRAVFHEYGMDGAAPEGYEVDHLITPALGGSDDIRNLWPESYSSEWNAHVKDELEDYLHSQVCAGRLDLPTAQHEIATNWIAAYQRYFHTERPLRRNTRAIAGREDDLGG